MATLGKKGVVDGDLNMPGIKVLKEVDRRIIFKDVGENTADGVTVIG